MKVNLKITLLVNGEYTISIGDQLKNDSGSKICHKQMSRFSYKKSIFGESY